MSLYLAALAAASAVADQHVPEPAEAGHAARITLDGRLDEPEWSKAQPVTRFFEIFPGDRSPPNERTEARFLYDKRFLYIGVKAFLKNPKSLRAPFVQRDRVNHSQDYVQIYLDPLDSGRSSYLFRVNARGSKADVLQDEDRQTENSDPDYAWDVATSIQSDGWSAEFRIPLSTLRISRRGAQKWKIIVYRGVPREANVQMATAAVPRTASCFLCYAGELVLPDLEPEKDDLLISASASALARHDSGEGRSRTQVRPKLSFDAQWLPSPGTAVDVTVKPDFIEVSPDQPQLTSNARFAINLPEKRLFFREGADLTQTPIPILYTRTVLAPAYGVRVTSRAQSFNGTIFAAKDDGNGGIVEPGFLSSAIAYPMTSSEVLFARSRLSVGAFDPGALVAVKRNDDGSFNAVGGPDLSWGDSSDRFAAQLAVSITRNPDRPELLPAWHGQSLKGMGADVQWDHTGAHWVWTARYSRYSDGFRTWLGYVPRVGYQEFFGRLKYSNTSSGPLSELSPYVSYDRLSSTNSSALEHDVAGGLVVSGPRDTNLDISLHPDAVLLNEQGQPRKSRFVQFTASSNPTSWIPNVGVSGQVGRLVDFVAGDTVGGAQVTGDLELRPLDRLDFEGHFGLTRFEGAHGGRRRLDEFVSELTATWFFSARLYALFDLQRYVSVRRDPPTPRARTHLINTQLSYEVNRDFQLYFGLRVGTNIDSLSDRPGNRTQIYFKIARTFHPHAS
jgi:hypothetical protein